jgi:aldose 1-epimerase
MTAVAKIHLASGPYQASLAPAAGGRLASLTWTGGADQPVHLVVPQMQDSFEPHHWPKAGAFPMVPFANRLPAAGFFFRSRWVGLQPAPGSRFALHGMAHRRPWQVLDVARASTTLMYRHPQGDEGWPWPFETMLQATVDGEGLHIALRMTNLSHEPMAAGLGWHPYHPLAPSPVATESLTFEALERWPLNPEGKADRDLSSPLAGNNRESAYAVAPGETIAFAGWNQQARIRVGDKVDALIRGRGWANLVVHRPVGASYLCVEPTVLLPGELGDAANRRSDAGVLLPEASTTAEWHCSALSR